MIDSSLPPEPEPPNEDGLEELGGLSPRDLLADGLHSPVSSRAKWEPPSAEHVARLLPQYRVEALVGHGGMGAVYRGSQPKLDRFVAIKLLPAELAGDLEFTARFEREARTLAKLHHPNIVGIHDFGQTSEGHLYFVMEFVDGTDLARVIASGSLEAMQALALTTQICDALQYAHSQRVIHRDIKPANVLVTKDGHAKLADFGLARPLHETDAVALTASHLVMGTPDYMAPEQRAGLGDHRVDIFALGVMLYEMLTGRRPHGVFDPPSVKVQVDVRLDEVVIKAMREEPERRYQQASEMRMDVDHIVSTPLPKVVEKPEIKAAEKPAAPKTSPRPAKARRAHPAIRSWIIPVAVVGLLALAAIVAVENGWLNKGAPIKETPESSKSAGTVVPATASGAVAPASAGWISLMDRIDPATDAVKGRWTRAGNEMHCAHVENARGPTVLQLPYEPPQEYDFRIAFTASEGGVEATQILSAFGHQFDWSTSSGQRDKWAGFSRVADKNMPDSPAAVKLAAPLKPNQRYESLVEVRRDRVTGYIDGRKIVDWPTDYHEMQKDGEYTLPNQSALGIGSWWAPTTFHDISVREVTGKGKFLRDASVAPPISPTAGWISLMDKIDPAADTVVGQYSKGQWSRVKDGIRGEGSGQVYYLLQLPYEPPPEYDFRISFTSHKRFNEAHQFFPTMGHQFSFMNAGGSPEKRAALNWAGGQKVITTEKLAELPVLDRRYESLVEVRRDRLTFYIDGKKVLEWKIDDSVLATDFRSFLPDARCLGIGVWDSATSFHDISVREVSGKGKFLRSAASSPAAASGPLADATKDAPFVNTLGMKFVPVPIIGGPTSGKRVLFSIWDTRVQDYQNFVSQNKREWRKPEFEQGPTHPAVMVTWDDAQAFCDWLTKFEKETGRLPTGWRYRLPSDHEWSCAAGIGDHEDLTKPPRRRDNGQDDIFPWGAQWPPPPRAGNYGGEELRPALAAGKYHNLKELLASYNDGFAETSPVASFPGNRFGLFDMGGNVWQWCEDMFNGEKAERTLRGGAWNISDRGRMLLKFRRYHGPDVCVPEYGFRCVLDSNSSDPTPGSVSGVSDGLRSTPPTSPVGEK